MIDGISKISNVRFGNIEANKSQEQAAKLPEQANDKVELSTENKDEQGSKNNKTLLYALGAAALAVGGYFLLRGKNSDALGKAGQDAADALGKGGKGAPGNTGEKLSREINLVKTLEKNPPKYPDVEGKSIETTLKNGGKRVDFLEDGFGVSEFYDKNNIMRRSVSYSPEGKLDTYVVRNKNGMPTYAMENKLDGTKIVREFKYNQEGFLCEQISNNGLISRYSMTPGIDGKTIIRSESQYWNGAVSDANRIRTVSTSRVGDVITKIQTSDYLSNTFKSENIKTGTTLIFVPKKEFTALKPGMKYELDGSGQLELSKTIQRYKDKNSGVDMVKITPADGGEVREMPFEDYKLGNFFD